MMVFSTTALHVSDLLLSYVTKGRESPRPVTSPQWKTLWL